MMFFCNNSIVTNNSFFNSGLILWGYQNEVYNNTVNGKPLVYLESTTDEVIDDAGQVILTDCTNVTINNLELSKIDMGIQLYDCTNCYIKSNVLSSNGFGIFIANSNSNIISGNILLNNWFGLLLTVGENNYISGNHFENGAMNVGLADTNNNLFLKNNFIFSKDNYVSPDNDFLFKLIFNRLKSIVSIESDNKWNGNYWNRPRILPVLIWGNKVIKLFRYRNKLCLDVDWHPAQKPYDIDLL